MIKRWTKYAWIVLLAALFASCTKDPELCTEHGANGSATGTERAIYSGGTDTGEQGGSSITDDDDDDDDAESSKKKATK